MVENGRRGFGGAPLLRTRCCSVWRVGQVKILLSLALLVGCLIPGCERSPSAPPEAQVATFAPGPEALSPSDVVRRVNEYRCAGRRGLIEECIVPEQRTAVLELVQAIDQLLAANEGLRQAICTHLGTAQAASFDLSGMANYAGVLSRDVCVIDEQITGDRAEVTIQIAKRVPLDTVELVRRDGRWLIRTENPTPGVAAEVCKLARVLREGARALKDKHWTAEQLRSELSARQAPITRRIAALTAEARNQSSDNPQGG